MKKTKIQKGITLIALIITIVVLLIFAIVTIGAVQESKIIGHSKKAANDYKIAEEKESIALGYSEYIIEKNISKDATLKVEGATVTGSEESGFKVTFDKTNNAYEVNSDGNITNIGTNVGDNEEIEITDEKDLATVGYFYNTMYNPEQPEIVTVDEYYDDEDGDRISDINSSLRAYTGGHDFDVPVTFFSQTPPTQGDIQVTITNYDGTEENITLTTTDNKKWTYKSMILTGKEDYVEWKEYIALDFYPYAKYSTSPSRYEANAGTHYFAFDGDSAMPFHKITILGETIEFLYNCQAYVGWGDLDFYDNINPVYNDISKVSKVIVNFLDNTSKKYTNENIFDVNSYYSEDSCFYYSSQDIPILYTNGAFIINMPEASLKNPITSIIVEEDGIATKYNITETTEIINSSAWN